MSYLLEIPHDRLPPYAEGARLIVVDDCALSGARLAALLDRLPGRRIIVAHLFSHPALREAIVATEPQVEACLAAEDLVEREPIARDAFEARWRARLPGRRYWLGWVEAPHFPWSEPERPRWDEEAGHLEPRWWYRAPRDSLAARVALKLPLDLPVGSPHTLPPGLVWRLSGEQVELEHLDGGRRQRLNPLASACWRALMLYGPNESAIEAVALNAGLSPHDAARELRIQELLLIELGLLAPPDAD